MDYKKMETLLDKAMTDITYEAIKNTDFEKYLKKIGRYGGGHKEVKGLMDEYKKGLDKQLEELRERMSKLTNQSDNK